MALYPILIEDWISEAVHYIGLTGERAAIVVILLVLGYYAMHSFAILHTLAWYGKLGAIFVFVIVALIVSGVIAEVNPEPLLNFVDLVREYAPI